MSGKKGKVEKEVPPSPLWNTVQPGASTTIFYLVFFLFPVCLGAYAVYNTFFVPGNLERLISLRESYGKQVDVVQTFIPMFFVLIIIEIGVTYWTGNLSKYYRANDSLSSLTMGSFQQLVVIFTRGISVYPFLFVRSKWTILDLDDNSWGHWVLGFLFVELMYYIFHRAAHEFNLLWAGHVVHHNSQEYNLTTALRQGIIQSLTSWTFQLPLAPFLTFPMFFFHASLNTMLQFWIHSRTIGRLPFPLEYIINTPSAHRCHHGRNPQYIDRNYGGTLIIFDIIFGTFVLEEEEVIYGITHDLGTWDPLYHQFHHLEETWDTFVQTPGGPISKLRVFLDRGPEYNYFLANPTHRDDPPPAITRETEERYDSTAPTRLLQAYAYLNGFSAIAGTVALMLVPIARDNASLLAPWVFATMWTAAAVLDRKAAAVYVDAGVRLPAAVALARLLAPSAAPTVTGIAAFLGVWHLIARAGAGPAAASRSLFGGPSEEYVDGETTDETTVYDPYLRHQPAARRSTRIRDKKIARVKGE